MPVKLDFEALGRDGAAEIVNRALVEAVANIMDPNTDHTKKRKIQLEIVLTPNEQRSFVSVGYAVKAALAPVKPVAIMGMVEADRGTGEMIIHIPEVGTHPDQAELPIDNPKVKPIKEARDG